MSNEKQCSVMTPVFDGTRYRHHICSECKGKIELTQSCYGGVSFYELEGYQCAKIKFCPNCGAEIIRFSEKPIYESPIDFSPLTVFMHLEWEYKDKARWLYFCYINEEHRKKIDALLSMQETHERYSKEVIKLAQKGRFLPNGLNAKSIRKLKDKFGEETE